MLLKREKKSHTLSIAAASLLALPVAFTLSSGADAAKRVNLTVISGNTHHYAPVGAAIKAFMPKVDEILARTGNYKASWVKGFGGQIVRMDRASAAYGADGHGFESY